MKEAVVNIRRKDLGNFDGQYNGLTDWFNLDHEI